MDYNRWDLWLSWLVLYWSEADHSNWINKITVKAIHKWCLYVSEGRLYWFVVSTVPERDIPYVQHMKIAETKNQKKYLLPYQPIKF